MNDEIWVKNLVSITVHCKNYQDRQGFIRTFLSEERDELYKIIYFYEEFPSIFATPNDFDIRVELKEDEHFNPEADLSNILEKVIAESSQYEFLNRIQFSNLKLLFTRKLRGQLKISPRFDREYEYTVRFDYFKNRGVMTLKFEEDGEFSSLFTFSKPTFSVDTLNAWRQEFQKAMLFFLEEFSLPSVFVEVKEKFRWKVLESYQKEELEGEK